MTIKIGVYDFFAYTIPGIIYLAGIAYALSVFGVIRIDFQTIDFSIVEIFGIVILAYVTGLIVEPISVLWHRLFMGKDIEEKALKEFKETHANLKTKFEGRDWPILLAKIRLNNLELAGEIVKYNATNLMLRNISFGLLVISIVQIIYGIQSPSMFAFILAFLLILASIISIRRSIRFARWFYLLIFETSVAIESEKQASTSKKKS